MDPRCALARAEITLEELDKAIYSWGLGSLTDRDHLIFDCLMEGVDPVRKVVTYGYVHAILKSDLILPGYSFFGWNRHRILSILRTLLGRRGVWIGRKYE